ncbi:MAG: hypothetical protein KDK36_08755, partial [Leptospiraceae bacterium]|nr:hypothetical protein [Leptospiraceae bacterium]
LSQEDIKFFHENWVIEETQFPSESIQSPTEVTNVNPTNKEDVPAKKIPVIPAKNEPNKIIAFFKEYKKAIIVSFIIIIFAIYKFRNGTSRSNTNLSGGMFSRLKDK